MKATFFIECAIGNSGDNIINAGSDSSGLPISIRFKSEKDDAGEVIHFKAILECTKGAMMEDEDVVANFRKEIGACTWGKEKKPIEIIVIENGLEGDGPTTDNCITWKELLMLLQQFASSPLIREVRLAKNETASAVGATPDHHVDTDIFAFYYQENPTSEAQEDIMKGFIGNGGSRKIRDGLNVANLWEDQTARHYACRLYFPPSVATKVSMANDLKKIGFTPDGGGMLGAARYVFNKRRK